MPYLSIYGYGSLMNLASVHRTMPNAINHRLGSLHGYERSFSLISVNMIKQKRVDWDTMEVASLAVRPADTTSLVRGCIFEIPEEELGALKEREHRYKLVQLEVIDHSKQGQVLGLGEQLELESGSGRGTGSGSGSELDQQRVGDCTTTLCYVVIEQTDADYRNSMTDEEYESRVGYLYPPTHREGFEPHACGKLWGRPDVKPIRPYLVMCLKAAIAVDEEQKEKSLIPIDYCDNLLDHCHLTDGSTVREYMQMHKDRFPEDLMKYVNNL